MDLCAVYLEALQGAMTRPMRGDPDAALQGFLTLNAAYFLGEWLADHTHTGLMQRMAARLDGIADLQPPDDETSALQLAQHARELAAAFGPTRWTDRIIHSTEHLVPSQPAAWDAAVQAALAAVAAGDAGRPLLIAHARRRLWELTNRHESTAGDCMIPHWALSYAYRAAESTDATSIQVAEAMLAELATTPPPTPPQGVGEGRLTQPRVQ
jgi:hypothetical protein